MALSLPMYEDLVLIKGPKLPAFRWPRRLPSDDITKVYKLMKSGTIFLGTNLLPRIYDPPEVPILLFSEKGVKLFSLSALYIKDDPMIYHIEEIELEQGSLYSVYYI